MKASIAGTLFACSLSVASARTFTVHNACPFTIWPAVFVRALKSRSIIVLSIGLGVYAPLATIEQTDLNVGTAVPSVETGWEAPTNTSRSFNVPDNWRAGRIWGRRNCDFSANTGPDSCLSGGCNGGLLCDSRTGTGVPPVTVAEWTLSGDGNRDFYDVSLVDGYNLPMRITTSNDCPVADCLVDLGPSCPSPLAGPFDANGIPVGCKSACSANLDGNQANSPNCCSGQYDTPEACPPSGIQYYSYFKDACPNSYVYAYDESSNTALWTCDSGRNSDYTLTFCP